MNYYDKNRKKSWVFYCSFMFLDDYLKSHHYFLYKYHSIIGDFTEIIEEYKHLKSILCPNIEDE